MDKLNCNNAVVLVAFLYVQKNLYKKSAIVFLLTEVEARFHRFQCLDFV